MNKKNLSNKMGTYLVESLGTKRKVIIENAKDSSDAMAQAYYKHGIMEAIVEKLEEEK